MSFFEEEQEVDQEHIVASKRNEDQIDSAYESNLRNTLWVERYRPRRISEYVGDEKFKSRMKQHIDSGDIPHILLYGPAGTGKTTISKMIANSVNCDLLYINASDENSVDVIREKIKLFACSAGFNDLKVIILDEASHMTTNAQAALKATMEIYSNHTRFILTSNYLEKIYDPIISRCQVEQVIPPNKAHIAKHLTNILTTEGVSFQLKDIVTIVNAHYPDIRKIIGTAQQFSKTDKTLILDEEKLLDGNTHLKIAELLKNDSGDSFTQIRQLLADNSTTSFDGHYKYLFDSVDDWSGGKSADCILILAEMQYKSSVVPDKEINFMSLIIQLLEKIK
jgi:DNA polymerase III delta prime subunit